MQDFDTPFLKTWPIISFKEYEEVDIDEPITRIVYKSFFAVLNGPEKCLKEFITLLLS